MATQQTKQPEPQALTISPIETSAEVHALVPTSIDGAMSLARWLAQSTLLPKSVAKEHDIFFIIQAGMELGLPPMAALRGLYVVHGRTALESKTKAALAIQKGKAEYFKRTCYTPQKVEWETKRRDTGEITRMAYTLKEAQDAWLAPDPSRNRPGKEGPWRDYTQRMLSYRALGWLCDDAYQDVVMGVATAEDFDPKEFTFKPVGGGVELATIPGAPAAERVAPAAVAVPADAKPANEEARARVEADDPKAEVGDFSRPEGKEAQTVQQPATQVRKPLENEDEIVELITQVGKFSSHAELKKWSTENLKTRDMSEAVRARLLKAYESQLDMIEDDARKNAQKGR